MSTSKASNRLHIIRVLRRGGVPPQNLLRISYALIRSFLDYCCVIWHDSLPKYLLENIEMVQKRALRKGKDKGAGATQLVCARPSEPEVPGSIRLLRLSSDLHV